MPRLFRAALAAVSLAVLVSLPSTAHASESTKVAIIVGPVGELTATYLYLAETAAATAERHGATVARAYSPNATPASVLAAVADAHVVVYFGHGWGTPSPYGGLNRAKMNGWGLQGPTANGTHSDAGSQIAYYGEDWILANARPAPGFVMIYSNTCYAPGASEGGHPEATASDAAQRVANYSRPIFALGGSAYYATDFDLGASDLVDRLLGNRDASFAWAFSADSRYVPWGLSVQAHHFSAGQQMWLHHSKYTDGPPNYWYAFAGNPDLTPRRAWDRVAPAVTLTSPAPGAVDVPANASIELRTSEPLNSADASTVRLLDADGAAVPSSFAYDAKQGVMTLTPEGPLRLSGGYRVQVAGPVDAAGNAVAASEWAVRTRLDADALVEAIPVVLEPGAHELVGLSGDAAGSDSTQLFEVADARWLTATARARLYGRPGSWLQLAGGGLDGWWVRESARAHAVGVTDEAALDPGTAVTLQPPRYALAQFDGAAMQPLTEMELREPRAIEVDRLVVLDGRTFLRLGASENGLAGAWVEVGAATVPAEIMLQRILATEQRSAPATGSVGLGDWTLFRFDDRGRVLERRDVASTELQGFATDVTLTIGPRRFFVINGGELTGWAVADHPRLAVVLSQAAAVPTE